MLVRHATLDDLDALAAVEAACFPPQEAADIDQLANRVESYPNHFWLLVNPAEPDNDCFPAQVDDGMLVSFIDGPCVGSPDLTDDMYASTALHAARICPEKTIIWQELTDHQNKFHRLPSKIWHNVIVRLFMQRIAAVAPRSEPAYKFISKYMPQTVKQIVDHGINVDKFTYSEKKERQIISSL